MKRSLVRLAVVFLLLFGAATFIRLRRHEGKEISAESRDHRELKRFWQAYQEATEARIKEDYSHSAALYRSALEIDPGHEDSLFYLAVSLEASGRYRDAAEVLRELTRRNPSSGRGWSQLGNLLATRAPGAPFEPVAAASAFARVEALNREQSGPFLSQGTLALELADYDEARRQFEIAASMGSPEGAFRAGLVAFLDSENEEAVRWLTQVLETSDRENAIAGRGIPSEGDVAFDSKLTPLESARIRSLLFLYWTSCRLGGYPESVSERHRIALAPHERLPRGKVRLLRSAALPERSPSLPEGLDLEGTWVSASVGDIDGDGNDEVFVLGWKRPGRLLRRRGSSFEDLTEQAGLEGVGGDGLSAIFFDFDRDSDPDLLVTAQAPLALSLRRLLFPEHRAETLTPRLFRNEGGRRFVEVTREVGLDRQYGVVEAIAHDVDADGYLDLVFAMGGLDALHFEPSVVLRNRGGRDFQEWTYLPSIDEPERALGVNVDSDGTLELVVARSSK